MTIQTKPAAVGEVLWFLNSLITVRVAAADSADHMTVLEHRMPYGDSPPLHVHRTEDEAFYVLEGTMRFRLNGKDVVANAGQTVLAPKNVPHTYRVESAAGARCLTITRNGDFERMVREMSRPATSADLPPRVEPTAQTIQALTMACARNGIDIVGAPLS